VRNIEKKYIENIIIVIEAFLFLPPWHDHKAKQTGKNV